MDAVILFEELDFWQHMLPLSYTRPVGAFRTGIYTQAERWEKLLGLKAYYQSKDYLHTKFHTNTSANALYVHSSVIADKNLANVVKSLKLGEFIEYKGNIIARYGLDANNKVEYASEILQINRPWDIFSLADKTMRIDFEIATAGKTSQKLSETNILIGSEADLFIEEGAVIEASVLNTKSGPIYIDKDAEIMESCSVRGPFYLGEHSQLKMGAKIYGAAVFGPQVKVGGEVNNAVIFGYSAKAHDGFLGNSVLGEWCNLGADTNNSNLKNNYAQVKVWSYVKEGFVPTGLQFCGLIMGDHSKSAINTMFNTGTVVGVSANIFGAGFPRNFVPSFSWGGPQGMQEYQLKQAVETAKLVYTRRNMEFDQVEQGIFAAIFEETSRFRSNL